MKLTRLLENDEVPPVLWHYTTEGIRIVRSGKLKGRLSATAIEPSDQELEAFDRQGVVPWTGFRIKTVGLNFEPFSYDPLWSGHWYEEAQKNWVDEQEWVSRDDIPLSAVSAIWVNPEPNIIVNTAESLPKTLLRKIGTPAAKMLAAIEYADSPRPSPSEALQVVKQAYGMLTNIPII